MLIYGDMNKYSAYVPPQLSVQSLARATTSYTGRRSLTSENAEFLRTLGFVVKPRYV